MSKETAIDWLVKTLELDTRFHSIMNNAIKEAKAKERFQITDAYGDGLNAYRVEFCNRDDYFNKVYGGQDE